MHLESISSKLKNTHLGWINKIFRSQSLTHCASLIEVGQALSDSWLKLTDPV